jgi:hypothetical protein
LADFVKLVGAPAIRFLDAGLLVPQGLLLGLPSRIAVLLLPVQPIANVGQGHGLFAEAAVFLDEATLPFLDLLSGLLDFGKLPLPGLLYRDFVRGKRANPLFEIGSLLFQVPFRLGDFGLSLLQPEAGRPKFGLELSNLSV